MTLTGIDPALMAFDIDGVVADTMGLFLDIAASEYQVTGVHYEDISCYFLEECIDMDRDVIDAVVQRLLEGNYHQSLAPMDGASAVLKRMAKATGSVLFVTARPHAGPLSDWFRKTLHLQPQWVEIVATGTSLYKADVLLERGITYFVEDRLDTCFALKEVGVTPIVFKQPWNREPHPFLEVDGWAEIGRLLALPAMEAYAP